MPTYTPIAQPISFKASAADLIGLKCGRNSLAADFSLPDTAAHVLRVAFDATSIVRLLYDMPLSTEHDNGPDVGRVTEHFAYRVEGAKFADDQPATWKAAHAPVAHYRFITGWTCLDVLSQGVPELTVIGAGDA